MIPNQWYPVLESREVPAHKPIGTTRMGEKLVFWRDQGGSVHCFRDQCLHRGAALSKGKIIQDHLQCPFHGFEYDSSGKCQYIPARGKNTPIPQAYSIVGYPLKESHDFIWLWWGSVQDQYPPLPWFEDLDEGFSYGRDFDLWPVHYSRAIENQLDVFHLPFVHYNTIGRGGRVVSDGPVTKLENETLKIWVSNRRDDGTPAKLQRELPEKQEPALLYFIFPNLWMNRLGDDFRIVVAFVPVDENHTRFYLRYYQRFIQVPILRDLVNKLTAIGSRTILRQDREVVITQQPPRSDYGMDERLIHSDRPIIEYRRHRKELKEKSTNPES